MQSRRHASLSTRFLIIHLITSLAGFYPTALYAESPPSQSAASANPFPTPTMPDPIFPAEVPPDFATRQQQIDSQCQADIQKAKTSNVGAAALRSFSQGDSGGTSVLKALGCSGIVSDDCQANAGGSTQGGMGGMNMMGGIGMGMGMDGGSESCAMYTDPSNYARLMAQVNAYEMAEKVKSCIAQCKLSKVAVGIAQVNCLNNKLQAMMDSIRILSKQFTSNITNLQTLNNKTTDRLADIEAQADDVKNRLEGTGGTPGITATVASLTEYTTKLPDQMQQISEQINTNNSTEKTINLTKASSLMTDVGECFKSMKMTNLKCSTTGDDVSVYDYIICWSQRNQQQLGTNNQVVAGGITSKTIDSKLNAIRTAEDNMLSLFPKEKGQTASIMSVADATPYAKQLPPPLDQEAISGLTVCNNMETPAVNNDLDIIKQQNDLKTAQSKVINDLNAQNTEIEKTYSQAEASLTGTAANLDLSACTKGTPEQRVSCTTNAGPALKKVLLTQPFSGTLRGTGSTPPLKFDCVGLTGCEKKLGNLGNDLSTAKTNYTNFKEQIGPKSLAAAQKTVTNLANQFAATNQQILNTYNAAMTEMGNLGVGFQQNPLGSVSSEELQVGSDGALQNPKSLINLIGGDSAMAPGMVDQKSLLDVKTQLTQQQQALLQEMPSAQELFQISQMKSQIQSKRQQCIQNSNAASLKTAASLAQAIGAANCSGRIDLCNKGSPDPVGQLLSAVNSLKANPAMGFQREDLDVLKSGIKNICMPSGAGDNGTPMPKYTVYEDSGTVRGGGMGMGMGMGGMGGMSYMGGAGLIFPGGGYQQQAQGSRLQKGEGGTVDCLQINELISRVQTLQYHGSSTGGSSNLAE